MVQQPDANGKCPQHRLQQSPSLTQQTCPPLPIDANGNCPGIDMRGGGLGLPPPPPSQPKQNTTYHVKQTYTTKNPDGSCPADYHYSDNSVQ